MKLTVSGKQIDVSEAFQGHVKTAFDGAMEKYSIEPVDAHVTITKTVHHKFHADISAHLGRGIYLRAQGECDEPYTCFDQAFEKLGGRLKKHKKRIVHHHRHRDTHGEMPLELAPKYIVSGHDEHLEEENPVIVAETQTQILTLTVSEAVMAMDLGDVPAIMFRNQKNGHLNMVYRRADGHIGWVDPSPGK